MGHELQKTANGDLQKSPVNNSTRHLLNSINAKRPLDVARNLQQYQEKSGLVKFEALLSIPLKDRLPGLVAQYGDKKVHAVLVIMLTEFVQSFNVGKTMDAAQIIACAYELIMSAEEDQFSIEDLALFFQKAKRGDYGKSYDRIDQPVIFEWFEQHRQARYEAFVNIKNEKAAQHKALGPSERTVQRNELAEKMGDLMGKMGALKEQLKEQREINRMNHFDKNG